MAEPGAALPGRRGVAQDHVAYLAPGEAPGCRGLDAEAHRHHFRVPRSPEVQACTATEDRVGVRPRELHSEGPAPHHPPLLVLCEVAPALPPRWPRQRRRVEVLIEPRGLEPLQRWKRQRPQAASPAQLPRGRPHCCPGTSGGRDQRRQVRGQQLRQRQRQRLRHRHLRLRTARKVILAQPGSQPCSLCSTRPGLREKRLRFPISAATAFMLPRCGRPRCTAPSHIAG